jgi:hypothetical protein
MPTLRMRSLVAYRIASPAPSYVRDERARYVEEVTRGASPQRRDDDPQVEASSSTASLVRAASLVRTTSLVHAVRTTVLHAVTAERAPAYLSILGALLTMRRDHELQPLVDDLERIASGGDEEAFARDLAQLAEWGCVEKHVEPLRIRGYKDARRERFRYRLSADALALLEWLEGRARERDHGGRSDERDLLADVLGQLAELERVSANAMDPGAPRRALHLLSAIDDAADAITEELIGFRARMLSFATGAYDGQTLREILGWLERYVTVHLAAVYGLRAEVDRKLCSLSSEPSLHVLASFERALESERATAPRAIRGSAVLLDPAEQLSALRGFFGPSGRLVQLCGHTDGSARDVLRKLHGHLRALERRSARRAELGRALVALRHCAAEPALAWLEALVASADVRCVPVGDEGRCPPPLPRRHVRAIGSRTPPLLTAKASAITVARGSRERRRAALATWLHDTVLGPREGVRMSEVGIERRSGEPVPSGREWIDLARARHLGRGRELRALGVRVTDVGGLARVGDARWSLEARDCLIERDPHAGRPR